jgi:hypothetical protein
VTGAGAVTAGYVSFPGGPGASTREGTFFLTAGTSETLSEREG